MQSQRNTKQPHHCPGPGQTTCQHSDVSFSKQRAATHTAKTLQLENLLVQSCNCRSATWGRNGLSLPGHWYSSESRPSDLLVDGVPQQCPARKYRSIELELELHSPRELPSVQNPDRNNSNSRGPTLLKRQGISALLSSIVLTILSTTTRTYGGQPLLERRSIHVLVTRLVSEVLTGQFTFRSQGQGVLQRQLITICFIVFCILFQLL